MRGDSWAFSIGAGVMPNLAMARLAILESWRRCGTVDDMGGGTLCRYGDIHWNVIGGLEYL